MSVTTQVAIVGGGITGLAAAHFLRARGVDDLHLFEAAPRFGGNIASEQLDDCTLDLGPDGWISSKPEVARLVDALGMSAELIRPLAGAKLVHIAHGGRLQPMPAGMVLGVPTQVGPFLRSPLLSWRGKLRALLEPWVPRQLPVDAHYTDRSVGDFARARLGAELTDTLLAPLLGGIFSGSAYDLSLATAFPQLAEAERRHGSLVRAMRERVRQAQQGRGQGVSFLSLRRGLGSLIDALVAGIPAERAHLGEAVERVEAHDAGYRVQTAKGLLQARTVVFAGPATHAARALALEVEGLAALQFGSAVTVLLGYDAASVQLPAGSGFIVPERERGERGVRITAGTFMHQKWPDRVPAHTALIRVFFGGADALNDDDQALIARGRADLRRLLGLHTEPKFVRITRLRGSSPRPSPGHLDRIDAIRARVQKHPGLYLIGNGYDGSGIPDCVRQAETAASQVAGFLAGR